MNRLWSSPDGNIAKQWSHSLPVLAVIITKARGLGKEEEEEREQGEEKEDTKYNTLIAVYFKLNLITSSSNSSSRGSIVAANFGQQAFAPKRLLLPLWLLSAHYHHPRQIKLRHY